MSYTPGHQYRRGYTKRAIWNRIYNLVPLSRRPPIHKCKLTNRIWEMQQARLKKPPAQTLGVKAERKNFDIGSY